MAMLNRHSTRYLPKLAASRLNLTITKKPSEFSEGFFSALLPYLSFDVVPSDATRLRVASARAIALHMKILFHWPKKSAVV